MLLVSGAYLLHIMRIHSIRQKCQMQDLPTASHRDETARLFGDIARADQSGSLMCSQSGHKLSPTGLTTPARSTKTKLTSND